MSGPESRTAFAALSDDIANVVERVSPAVVAVNGRARLGATGIVWSPGVIVTADHVVERDDDLTVTDHTGQRTAATVAGRDPGSDVAVLRAEGVGGPGAVGTSSSVSVGNIVLALGRPRDSISASLGVVSALGQTFRTARGGVVNGFIRSDITMYPGFSGGPLVGANGEIIAMNSSHLARGQELAIPIAALAGLVESLVTQGSVRRGYLGITSRPVRLASNVKEKSGLAQETGLLLLGVETGSPAESGGLFVGDILVAVGETAVGRPEELQSALGPSTAGKPLQITVLRGGDRSTVTVTPSVRE